MEFFIIMFVFLVLEIAWVIEKINGKRGNKNQHTSSFTNTYQPLSQENNTLPNGHTRQEYYNYGYSDEDIELWGLDQPGAPDPNVSGVIIADMMDGDLDGNSDFPF